MHMDQTLDILDSVTTVISEEFREFNDKTCPHFQTRELPHERDACKRHLAKKSHSRHRSSWSIRSDRDVDEPPHQIRSYTLLFSLFPHFPYIANPPLRTSAPMRPHATALALARQSHSLYRTDLAYLMDIWLTIHMYLLLFLASPMCPLLRSGQSRGLALRGQALSIASPYAPILVYHSYLASLYLPFPGNIITEAPTNCLYESPPKLRFHTYTSRLFRTISHYFASHRTATIPPSLLATIHLETIPYPQIAPPQSPIGFILRSPAT